MPDRWWIRAFAVLMLVGAGCSRGARPAFTVEGAKKELQELDASRKKEWTPPDN